MKTYTIPVSWSVCADLEIQAESLAEAKKIAMDTDLPHPDAQQYIDGSFEINDEVCAELNPGEDDVDPLAEDRQMILGDCKIGQRVSYFDNQGKERIATVVAKDNHTYTSLLGWFEGEDADPNANDVASLVWVGEEDVLGAAILKDKGCVKGMWRYKDLPVNLV